MRWSVVGKLLSHLQGLAFCLSFVEVEIKLRETLEAKYGLEESEK